MNSQVKLLADHLKLIANAFDKVDIDNNEKSIDSVQLYCSD